jgi:hypothetical protein
MKVSKSLVFAALAMMLSGSAFAQAPAGGTLATGAGVGAISTTAVLVTAAVVTVAAVVSTDDNTTGTVGTTN